MTYWEDARRAQLWPRKRIFSTCFQQWQQMSQRHTVTRAKAHNEISTTNYFQPRDPLFHLRFMPAVLLWSSWCLFLFPSMCVSRRVRIEWWFLEGCDRCCMMVLFILYLSFYLYAFGPEISETGTICYHLILIIVTTYYSSPFPWFSLSFLYLFS